MYYAGCGIDTRGPYPYSLTESGNPARVPYTDTTGRVRRPDSVSGSETTGIFVVIGDSMAGNHHGTPLYTPVNASKVDQLNIYDGLAYNAIDPLIGCTGSSACNIFTRVADKLITAGVFQRVILVPIAITGALVSEWATDTTVFVPRIRLAATILSNVGLNASAYLWMQGPNDKAAGTTQGSYTSSLATVLALPNTYSRNGSSKWLVAQCSFDAGSTSSGVRAAQAAAVNGTTVFAGPDCDSITGASNRPDSGNAAHFTATGADAVADLWKTAIDTVF